MLEKYMKDASLIIPTKDIKIKDNLPYEEIQVHNLDCQVHKFIINEVPLSLSYVEKSFCREATWKVIEGSKNRYLHLFEPGENFLTNVLIFLLSAPYIMSELVGCLNLLGGCLNKMLHP